MNVISHESNCVLAGLCSLAAGPKCTPLCAPFVAMHGFDGAGGRSASANLPDDYRLVTLRNAPPRKDQPKAYGMVDDYAQTFKRQFEPPGTTEPIKSLYLYSDAPGTGKTTTAAALLNEWLTVHLLGSFRRVRQPLERPAYFLDVNAWQSDFNMFNRPRVPDDVAEPAAQRYYRAMHYAERVPFAVLDDIGVRNASEAFRGDLHTIINARVTEGLPTVYTSNVPIDALATVFDKRLYDRIRDQCAMIPFIGVSKRGMRKTK